MIKMLKPLTLLLRQKYIDWDMWLLYLAVIFWIHSLIISHLNIGYWGILESFTVTFYLGIACLITSFCIQLMTESENEKEKEKHSKFLFWIKTIIFIAMFWLSVPIIGGSTPFLSHALRSLGLIEYISRTGDITGNVLAYLSWSGTYLLPALSVKLFHINYEPIINYVPFITQLVCLPLLYIFLRNTICKSIGKSKYIWIGIWFYYIFRWIGDESFLSASAFGMLLLLGLLDLITLPRLLNSSDNSYKHWWIWILIVLLFTWLVITHFLTSIIAIILFGSIWIVKHRNKLLVVTIVCSLILTIWSFTGASRYTQYLFSSIGIVTSIDQTTTAIVGGTGTENVWENKQDTTPKITGQPTQTPQTQIPTQIIPMQSPTISPTNSIPIQNYLEMPKLPMLSSGNSIVLNPKLIVQQQILTYISGNESHQSIVKTTIYFSLLMVILSIIGAVFAIWKKKSRKMTLLIMLISLIPMLILPIPYGGRVIIRLYSLELIFASYFIAQLVDIKSKIIIPVLCSILLLMSPVHIIAHYGNESYEYMPQEISEGLHYFQDNANGGYITGLNYPWLYKDLEKYYYLPFENFKWSNGKVSSNLGDKNKDYWIYITSQDKEFYDLICNEPNFVDKVEQVLSQTSNVTLEYSNPDFKLYKFDLKEKE